jgi:uncharacterized protein YqhQ
LFLKKPGPIVCGVPVQRENLPVTVRQKRVILMPETKKLNVGGQAVLEGVMMRSRRFWAVAVRKPDGTIGCGIFKEISITNRKKVLGWPFIRGIVALVENL